jgi:HEPN domain-containing protein
MFKPVVYLTEFQQAQLGPFIQQIIETIQPEMIICYGIRSNLYKKWGCFLEHDDFQETPHLILDLLIIVGPNEKRPLHDITDKAEHNNLPHLILSCLTHKLNSVNDALENGHPFFSTLYHKGVLLYDSGRVQLSVPEKPELKPIPLHLAEANWQRWHGLAKTFLQSAISSMPYDRPDLTVFLLHQAVEHTCIALIRVFTGYRPNTHNLTRLFAMIENFSQMLKDSFSSVTPEERDLLNTLVKGYTDTRYKDDYLVEQEKISQLVARIKRMHSIAESIYDTHVRTYEANTNVSSPAVIE